MQVGNAGGTVTVTISKVLSIISSIEALSFTKQTIEYENPKTANKDITPINFNESL